MPHSGYNPCTLENHSTADLYYDATTLRWPRHSGVFSPPQALYFTMQLGCIYIHPKVCENSRVHGLVLAVYPFEVWLHHAM